MSLVEGMKIVSYELQFRCCWWVIVLHVLMSINELCHNLIWRRMLLRRMLEVPVSNLHTDRPQVNTLSRSSSCTDTLCQSCLAICDCFSQLFTDISYFNASMSIIQCVNTVYTNLCKVQKCAYGRHWTFFNLRPKCSWATCCRLWAFCKRNLCKGKQLQLLVDLLFRHWSTASRAVSLSASQLSIILFTQQLKPLPHCMTDMSSFHQLSISGEQSFDNRAKILGVIGAIDCTHVAIQSPGSDDAEIYRKQKSYFSINVQLVYNWIRISCSGLLATKCDSEVWRVDWCTADGKTPKGYSHISNRH